MRVMMVVMAMRQHEELKLDVALGYVKRENRMAAIGFVNEQSAIST